MSSVQDRLWAWYNEVAGRPYELGRWDCFQLALEAQAVAGFGRAFEPVYRSSQDNDRSAGKTLLRNFARGFARFKRIDAPCPGAVTLFRDDRVPVHVGIWMRPHLMVHVCTDTATTLAEIGPSSDYHFSLDGFYVPA